MSKFWNNTSGGDDPSSSSSSSSSHDGDGDEEIIDGNDGELKSNEEEEPNDEYDDQQYGIISETNITWEKIRDSQVFLDVPVSTSSKKPSSSDYTRLVIISDTHGQHRKIILPKGDVLIHGGDFTKTGEVKSIEDLSSYFAESGFEEIVVIAGNHDMTLDPEYYKKYWQDFHRKPFDCDRAAEGNSKKCDLS